MYLSDVLNLHESVPRDHLKLQTIPIVLIINLHKNTREKIFLKKLLRQNNFHTSRETQAISLYSYFQKNERGGGGGGVGGNDDMLK